MIEGMHAIAPGATFAFYTADFGEVDFAAGIAALAAAGCNIIVDDVGFSDETFYQDGVAAQAVDQVVAQGVTYFSAAGNEGNAGYESQFRPLQTTVAGVGTGTFQNFNPNGGSAPTIAITVTAGNTLSELIGQFDQPAFTTNGVTSTVTVSILNAAGTVVATGTNPVGSPIITVAPTTALAAGTYQVAIEVTGGPNPGHVMFYDPANNDFTVDQQYGSAGGTFYPTTVGHPAAAAAIGVGAVSWWGGPPFSTPTQINNDVYSSFGPNLSLFNPNGTPKTPQLLQKPDVSGVNGYNTSFFIPGNLLNTATPPPQTAPATPTNLASTTYPAFFGTSAAAPTLAAVAALMKQLNPTVTRGQILSAMQQTATPLDGQSPQTYNPQAGFGLVNAVKALTAVSLLQVTQTAPTTGVTLTTSTPSSLTVTFSKPIVFSQVKASDLQFTQTPAGVTVAVGTPILVNPTTVQFPLILNTADPTASANGKYAYTIGPAGAITSTDGKPLVPFSGNFALNIVTSPVITNVLVGGRIIVVNFSEAMRLHLDASLRRGGVESRQQPLGLVRQSEQYQRPEQPRRDPLL